VSVRNFRKETNTFSEEKGFTLIEVMIAMAVFAIGILAVGSMQLTAAHGNTESGKMTTAATIAQNQMEQLISTDYDDPAYPGNPAWALNDTNGDGTAGLNSNTAGTADHADPANPVNGQYFVYWNIAADNPIRNTKTIEVIVTWRNGRRQVALTSIKDNIL